jgi:predicted DsbA family dithiol-disulfide isomerase
VPLSIAIISDVICPWCFVGKRRLERALSDLGLADETVIEWLPFELNPDMPEDGMPRALYRERKFGAARSAALDAEMTRLGREDGIAFAFDRMERTPNTRRAHMALAFAGEKGRANALKEGLMRAYFEEARDVGREDVILDIAEAVGLARGEVAAALQDGGLRDRVVASERRAAEMGVSGVPFFIVDRAWAVSGAQPAEQWVAALRQASAAAGPAAAP